MKKVRIGVIGLGNMGANHAASIAARKIPRLELAAICDTDETSRGRFPGVPSFATPEELLAAGGIDAVLIATPHFAHTPIGIKALRAGLHVMVEKPISVHKADAEKLLAAHKGRSQVFAVMFNQRTDECYGKVRELVHSGELGRIRRVNWIMTTWFRTEYYYSLGGWRATWRGEGGGVLLNQCLHNLDILQWIFGLPKRVRAHCGFGRHHDIEVEDDVTAYLEFGGGATGVFITSTGEAPGTNRLEITADAGKVVYENDRLTYARNEIPMSEFSRTSRQAFARPACVDIPMPVLSHGGQHNEVLKNFADAILDRVPLIAPAAEGIRSVELANAMLMSSWTDETIELPINARRYERLLKKKIAGSRRRKKATSPAKLASAKPAASLFLPRFQ